MRDVPTNPNRPHLFVPNKYDYIRGERPQVDCILCEVVARRDTVERLEVHRTGLYLVSLNLYPYNPGHLLIFPARHVVHLQELQPEEVMEAHHLANKSIELLDELYHPRGYNVGYNVGHASGASIEHLHMHVVPRYDRELGFMDIIGGAKIMVEDPLQTRDRLRDAFSKVG
jgi:ATP adenylyltransferase